MIAHVSQASLGPADRSELDALSCAIADAIKALVAWDVTAFEFAIERQSALCEHLASAKNGWNLSPGATAAAHKVQELNRVYDRLLQHSAQWTRTIGSILQAGGHRPNGCTSVHFRA